MQHCAFLHCTAKQTKAAMVLTAGRMQATDTVETRHIKKDTVICFVMLLTAGSLQHKASLMGLKEECRSAWHRLMLV